MLSNTLDIGTLYTLLLVVSTHLIFLLLFLLLFHPNDVADVVLAATTLSVALRLTRLLYYDTKHENSMQRVEE